MEVSFKLPTMKGVNMTVIDFKTRKVLRDKGERPKTVKGPATSRCRKCSKAVPWDDWGIAVDDKKRKNKWESGHLVCPHCEEYQEDTIISRISTITDEGIVLNIPFDVLMDIDYYDDQVLDVYAVLMSSCDALIYAKFKKSFQEYIDGK